MFTETQLISFGNFLLKNYGVQIHSTDGKNIPLYQREVCDADFCNWKQNHLVDSSEPPPLPSQHQLGAPVWLRLWSAEIICEVLSIHFHEGKVKYDLKVIGDNGESTRIYNVDSAFVGKRKTK